MSPRLMWTAAAAAAAWLAPTVAADDLEKKFNKAAVSELAVRVCKAAHSSGQRPTLLSHKVILTERRVRVRMAVEYFGIVSGTRFEADAEIRLDVSDPGAPVVEDIEFVDKGRPLTSPDENKLRRLARELTRELERK